MPLPTPEDVDSYLEATLLAPDEGLNMVTRHGLEAGLPDHGVSALQGAFLTIITRALKAKRVLEIGTLAGYSTICLARGVGRDGVVITLENDPKAIAVASKVFQMLGGDCVIQIIEGDAVNSLANMSTNGCAPFDLIFVDADKPSNPIYLDYALKLSKPGTLIIGDNVVRGGAVANADNTDPKVQGVRTFLDAMGQNRSLLVTALQTVGGKGHDGLSIAVVV